MDTLRFQQLLIGIVLGLIMIAFGYVGRKKARGVFPVSIVFGALFILYGLYRALTMFRF